MGPPLRHLDGLDAARLPAFALGASLPAATGLDDLISKLAADRATAR